MHFDISTLCYVKEGSVLSEPKKRARKQVVKDSSWEGENTTVGFDYLTGAFLNSELQLHGLLGFCVNWFFVWVYIVL